MKQIGVIGAGTMGHGIAQVSAMAGYRVHLVDANPAVLSDGIAKITANLNKGIVRAKLTQADKEATLQRIHLVQSLEAVADGSDLVIEAVPEKLALKRSLFLELQSYAKAECIFATNTSSLSVEAISEGLDDPGRVIGAHFFNPVHIMRLLEVIVSKVTHPHVLQAMQDFGEAIQKETIVVKDFPGFATSRLGVCLGMEAIRMVEQGVASAEDIDKAMVLGYKHPIGPLKLTDLVGLDVRMHIGEYLAKELDNKAFEPPHLMRKMVDEGRLGKKSGRGFYAWEE